MCRWSIVSGAGGDVDVSGGDGGNLIIRWRWLVKPRIVIIFRSLRTCVARSPVGVDDIDGVVAAKLLEDRFSAPTKEADEGDKDYARHQRQHQGGQHSQIDRGLEEWQGTVEQSRV